MKKAAIPETQGKTGRRFKKRWQRVVTVLCALVVFCTVYALMLPAVTMEKTACIYPVHTHEAECCDADGNPVCGYADFVVHSHSDACYDETGALWCTLPEITEHTHTEACYLTAHTHTDACYTEGELTCGMEEVSEEDALVPVCGKDEIILHEHTEECFDETDTLICGRVQVLRHEHDETCMVAGESTEDGIAPISLDGGENNEENNNEIGSDPVQEGDDPNSDTGTVDSHALTVTREGATSMTVNVSSGGTLTWSETETNTAALLTGDTMKIIASAGNTQGTDSYVYRLYFKKGASDCSLNITAGETYTFDGKTATCHAIEGTDIVYLEFSGNVGETVSLSVEAVYPNYTSAGGGLTVWGEIAETGSTASAAEPADAAQKITAAWSTKRDNYPLTKTNNNTGGVAIVGTDDGTARPAENLNWTITLKHDTSATSDYGKNIVTKVTFEDTLTLPAGLSWSGSILNAASYTVEGNYFKAGDVVFGYMNTSSSEWGDFKIVKSEDGTNLIFTWTCTNPYSNVDLGQTQGDLYIFPRALVADTQTIATPATVTNSVTATRNYAFGEDVQDTATAPCTLSVQQGSLTLSKSADKTECKFGEDITYTVSLKNPGATAWTGAAGSYRVQDDLDVHTYLSPVNMQTMFNDTYGANLTVTITNAAVHAWEEVTAADGTSSAYRNPGNSSLGTETNTLTVKKTGANEYTVTGGVTSPTTGTTVAEALQSAGYAVTENATYRCTWDLPKEEAVLTLAGGQTNTYTIYATAKSTFGMITNDWPGQYPDTDVTATNNAFLYSTTDVTDNAEKSAYANTTLTREAKIGKSVSKSDGTALQKGFAAKNGEVLGYTLTFTHEGSGTYENLPMVDDLYGSQYLLAPVAENSENSSLNRLTTKEIGGVNYYILTEGTYSNVKVGTENGALLTAATVTVTTTQTETAVTDGSYTGAHTEIKWYYASLAGGSYTKTVTYKTVVDTSAGGSKYSIGNTVWMNDRTGNRIYAGIWGGGTVIDFEKKIVTERGANPASDTLDADDYSLVGPGDTITYRIVLANNENGTASITGGNFKDVLPETYGEFSWAKNVNVSLAYQTSDDIVVAVSGLETWSIAEKTYADLGLTGDGTRWCITWPDTTSVDFTGKGTLYLYITLTFPSDTAGGADTWTQYAAANKGAQIENTLYVYDFPDEVRHDLKETGSALLQKGVLGLATQRGYYYITGTDRSHYPSPDSYERSVFYYVALYNGGNKRLYLNDLTDKLPSNFRYSGLLPSDFNPTPSNGNRWSLSALSSVTAAGGTTSKLVSATDLANGETVTFKSAQITATTSNDKKTVTFSVGAGSGDYAIRYDSERGQYYLDRGEALVFGYIANVALVMDGSSVNTVGMPYTDYLSTGANVLSQSELSLGAVKTSRYSDQNDGSRAALSSEEAAAKGFTAEGSGTWLVSEVSLASGGIVPGITKYTESSTTNPTDGVGTTTTYTNSVNPTNTVNWRVRVTNSGTTGMSDYTVTDVMPSPYVFTGNVTYCIYDSGGNQITNDKDSVILSFGERSANDDSVTVTDKLMGQGGKTVTLTRNGTETELFSGAGNGSLLVSLNVDANGNEVLTLHFKGSNRSIPEGGYIDVRFHSKNPTTTYENRVYVNHATVTPNVQSFTTAGQGSIVYGDAVDTAKATAVTGSSPVTVSFGYATSSLKSVAEESNAANTAVSTDTNNTILLSSAESTFRYTLTVNNDTDKAMTKLVLIDSLPDVGDTSPFDATAARNSEFKVNFAENPNVTVTVKKEDGSTAVLDASADYTVEYGTATSFLPQSDDWMGDNTGNWGSTSENARSIRAVITDAGATKIPAKSSVSVSFSAVADASALPGKVAWNSFGYHYAVQDEATELESMPLTVGVKIPSVPALTKKLVNDQNAAITADADTGFRFLIYEGEALTGCTTEAEYIAALGNAKKNYMIAAVTVKAGASESDPVKLSPTTFSWTQGSTYTVTELPDAASGYKFREFTGNTGESVTFTYDSDATESIVCVNEQKAWSLSLTKTDSLDADAKLPGAVFALYTPEEAEKLNAVPTEYADLGIALQVTQGETTYSLFGVVTTSEDGTATFANLTQESYYLTEVKAPSGYKLPAAGQVVNRSAAVSGVSAVTLTNEKSYELPHTGGIGTLPYVLLGTLLVLTAAGALLLRRKREKGA